MPNSLVIKQFTAICRGEMGRQEPYINAQIHAVGAVESLCMRCQYIGEQDLIQFSGGIEWRVCRACRQVYEDDRMTDVAMMDDGTFRSISVDSEG